MLAFEVSILRLFSGSGNSKDAATKRGPPWLGTQVHHTLLLLQIWSLALISGEAEKFLRENMYKIIPGCFKLGKVTRQAAPGAPAWLKVGFQRISVL